MEPMIPIIHRGDRQMHTPESGIAWLTEQSRAYNVGYALGMTMAEIDALPEAEFNRLIPLAKETLAGDRSTAQHRKLAEQRVGYVRWLAGEERP